MFALILASNLATRIPYLSFPQKRESSRPWIYIRARSMDNKYLMS
jgi:hypothetical protein